MLFGIKSVKQTGQVETSSTLDIFMMNLMRMVSPRHHQHVQVLGCVIPLGITSMRFLIMKTSRKGLSIVEEDLVNSLFAFGMYFLSLS
jgi:hypothetical protein